jgi:hypothetical protein
MRFYVYYSEHGVIHTLYAKSRKQAEGLALQLFAEKRDSIRMTVDPKRRGSIACLVLGRHLDAAERA